MKTWILSVVLLLISSLAAFSCGCNGEIGLLDHISSQWFEDYGLIWIGEPTDEIVVGDAEKGVIGRKFLVVEVLYGEIATYQTNPTFINTDEYIWVISENEEFCYESTVGFEGQYLFATAYNPCFNFWSYSISNCLEDVIPYEEGITGYIFDSFDPDEDPMGPPMYTLTMEDLAEFIDDALGSVEEVALSLELIDFRLEQYAEHIEILWETASERDNEYFELQKSIDGILFETIKVIPGAINSNTIEYYSYKDTELSPSTIYYRLKSVSTRGEEEIYKIISMQGATLEANVEVYPNPATTFLKIELGADFATIEKTVNVYDIKGQLVISEISFNKELMLDVHKLSQGMYFLEIQTENTMFSKKISIVE